MGAVTFNNMNLSKVLSMRGIDEEQAAAISAGILRAYEVAELATKGDLREVHMLMKADLREVQTQMAVDLREVQAQTDTRIDKLEAEIEKVKTTLSVAIRESQAQTDARVDNFELRVEKTLTEMKGEIVLVRWMLGLIIVGIIGLIVKSFFGG